MNPGRVGLGQERFDQRRRRRAIRAIASVGAGLRAGQHDFLDALFDSLLGLRHDVFDWRRSLASAHIGDDAERADVVAAFLDLDERPGPAC